MNIFQHSTVSLYSFRYPYFYKGQNMNLSLLLYPLSHSVSIRTSIQKDVTCMLFYSNCLFLCLYSNDFRAFYSTPWRRQWHPTPVLLPGKSHGWRSLVGYSPWDRQESDTTERLHFHFSLSCIGEGNGNPLQCSCLENPRDVGAWWAAVCGVAQSRTRLKRFSSSSSIVPH